MNREPLAPVACSAQGGEPDIREHSRLLLLACTRYKRSDDGMLPAIERYDGPTFRVVRKWLREHPPGDLQIWILSARYGLIPSAKLIPDYDLPMTAERAAELRLPTKRMLERVLCDFDAGDVLVVAGRAYRSALAGWDGAPKIGTAVLWVEGPIGRQLSLLSDWLNAPEVQAASHVRDDTVRPLARLRNVDVSYDHDGALARIRTALAAATPRRYTAQTYYIEIDGVAVSCKWVAGQLSGLGVAEFHSHDAVRLLQGLGFDVRRR